MLATMPLLKIRPAHPVRRRSLRAGHPVPGTRIHPCSAAVHCAYVDGRVSDVVPDRRGMADAFVAARRATKEGGRGGTRGRGRHPFVWVDLHDPQQRELAEVAEIFGLPRLAVDDAGHTHRRPALDSFDDVLVAVLKAARHRGDDGSNGQEPVGGESIVVLGHGFVVTVRRGAHRSHPLRSRLEASPEALGQGPSTVLHAVADLVVDDYRAATEAVRGGVEDLETGTAPPARSAERIERLAGELSDLDEVMTAFAQPLRLLLTRSDRVVHRTVRERLRDVEDRLSRARKRVAALDGRLTSLLQPGPHTPADGHAAALRRLLEGDDLPRAQRWLADHPPYVIADELARMEAVTAVMAFRLLDKDRALAVFEELEPADQQAVLSGLRDHAFHELVEAMDPDDRARMLGEAPAKVAKRVLAGLSPRERRMTAALLGYPEASVGRVMTPESVALARDLTAEQALRSVRAKGAGAETVYTLPVVDTGRRLVGVVELRDLVLSPPERQVAYLVDSEVPRVRATDPAEGAARLMRETNVLALPVVDGEDRLVGLLTIDDAVEVIEAADTEDVARQSGATPLSGHYMSASVWQLARSRALWLLLLIVAATLTVNVLQAFEATLAQVTALALFIPLLVGTGGNAGAQAATAAVRALAVGEVRGSDLLAVIWRECRVGLALGTMLAAVGMGVGLLVVGGKVALVVGLSLVAICAWAATVGATMPLLAKRLRIDPAVVSAPMVTTLVDATGLIIYFMTAHIVLGL